ncbi:MAG: hypothetical protein AAGC65_22630 [Mucilaginibacter sp.]|uniref:hypothetical protein n=1 Tax=Mucilaginibacter sp. TaxID=1882438 RepID=UPI00319F02A6
MKTPKFNHCQWYAIVLAFAVISGCKKEAAPEPSTNSTASSSMATKQSLVTQAGQLYIGTAFSAPTINSMTSIASASNGTMYVSDYPDDVIYKIAPTGTVTKFAQNVNSPSGLKVAKNGDVYAALYFDNKIIKITAAGVVDTLKLNLTLNHPTDVAVADDNTLYIADGFHKRILKVSPAGVATVLAGKLGSTTDAIDGPGDVARFNYPTTIKLGADGYLWVVDGDKTGGSGLTLRRVTTQGVVKTVLNVSGSGMRIYNIQPAKLDANFNPTTYGNVFILFDHNNKITQYNTLSGTQLPVTQNTTSGYVDGPIATALLQSPMALSIRENVLYVTDNIAHVIRKIYKK